jgi:hypothetical protein
MLELRRLLCLLTVVISLAACAHENPATSDTTDTTQADAAKADAVPAPQSDLSLAVGSDVKAGDKISGFAGSSHPPVVVWLESEAGKMLPTVGVGSPDERRVNFEAEVPQSCGHDVVVVTARDGTGTKIVKKVRVIRE